jgi:hypothetical protein
VRLVLGKVPRAHLTFAVVTRHGAVVAVNKTRRQPYCTYANKKKLTIRWSAAP